MSDHSGQQIPEITVEEHQHNLRAKRVIQLDELGNAINGAGLTPGIDYNYLDVQQTDSDTETFVYKTGGSGGTTIRTLVVNYTDSNKTDLDNITWS